MSFADYDGLQAEVLANHWDRDSTQIVSSIQLAHARINLGLRTPFMQKTADLTVTDYRVAAPSDFASVGRLWFDDSYDTPLSPTSPDRIAALRAANPSAARAQFFAIEGDDDGEYFVFDASLSATGKLLYTRRLAFFASGAATNVVLTRYPHLYLYGALLELALFTDDAGRTATYSALFRDMLDAINMQTRSDAYAGGAAAPLSGYVV